MKGVRQSDKEQKPIPEIEDKKFKSRVQPGGGVLPCGSPSTESASTPDLQGAGNTDGSKVTWAGVPVAGSHAYAHGNNNGSLRVILFAFFQQSQDLRAPLEP